MATLQNLYNNIKTLITKYFEEKTIEDETLPQIVESYFNYNQGELNVEGITSTKILKLTVTGSSFATYSSTPFTYTGKIFVDWGDNTLIEYTGGKLSHNFIDELSSHTIKVYGDLTSLKDQCFYQCTGLTQINIPNSVSSLENGCFWGCTGLTSITLPNSLSSLGNNCFHSCSSLTSINIPNGVTSLGKTCFHGCSGLTSITISNSVTSLGNSCFRNCTGLTSITIPDSVINVEAYCFQGCTSLTSIHLNWSGNNIPTYQLWIYQTSSSLKLNIPQGTTQLYIDKGYPSDKLVESD